MGILMRRIFTVILCISIVTLFCGCSMKKMDANKIRDIEFTVTEEENIPEELWGKMQERGKKPFKLTYADQGELYIAVGYGEQTTSGYSIEVTDCYETKNAIYVHTNLIGPSKDEKIMETETYPYVVIKMEYVDKNVVFQ